MGGTDDMQPGEIARTLHRMEDAIRTLTAQVQAALAPIGIHGVEIEALKKRADELDEKVEDVTAQANKIAGASGIVAVLAGLFSGLIWKK